jgi:Na+/H+ antiporter NhaA
MEIKIRAFLITSLDEISVRHGTAAVVDTGEFTPVGRTNERFRSNTESKISALNGEITVVILPIFGFASLQFEFVSSGCHVLEYGYVHFISCSKNV